jgi:hypothetical protein
MTLIPLGALARTLGLTRSTNPPTIGKIAKEIITADNVQLLFGRGGLLSSSCY